MKERDALILVDVQNDFCPGGALAVEEGDVVVPVLNEWIQRAKAADAMVVASRDWHPQGHCSFQEEGGPWPVHCVQGTAGAMIRSDLDAPDLMLLVSKGRDPNREQYSAFDGTGLGAALRARGVHRLYAGGLAQDVCVRQTVLDACAEGFETHLILDATRPVDPENGRRAVVEMTNAGAIIEALTS